MNEVFKLTALGIRFAQKYIWRQITCFYKQYLWTKEVLYFLLINKVLNLRTCQFQYGSLPYHINYRAKFKTK